MNGLAVGVNQEKDADIVIHGDSYEDPKGLVSVLFQGMESVQEPDNSFAWEKVSERDFAGQMAAVVEQGYAEQQAAVGTPGLLDEHGLENIVIYHRAMLCPGAISGYVQRLIRGLLARNPEVIIHLLYYNYEEDTKFSEIPLQDPEGNIRVVLHGIPVLNASTLTIRAHLRTALEGINSSQGIDLIMNNEPRPSSVPMLDFADEQRIAVATYYHGGRIYESTLGLLQRSTIALTNSHWCRVIFKMFGVRVDVLRYAFDLASFHPDSLGAADYAVIEGLREKHGLENKTVALCVGRYDSTKSQADAIEALRIIKEKGREDLAVVFIGNESEEGYLDQLKRMVSDYGLKEGEDVIFLGFLPHTELRHWLTLANIGLVPSRYSEPLGMVSVEMQASGMPVIVYDSGGLPETLKHGKTGIITSQNRPEELADAILLLADNEEDRMTMAREALEFIRQIFSAEMATLAFEEMAIEAHSLREEGKRRNLSVSFDEESLGVKYSLSDGRRIEEDRVSRVDEGAILSSLLQVFDVALKEVSPDSRQHDIVERAMQEFLDRHGTLEELERLASMSNSEIEKEVSAMIPYPAARQSILTNLNRIRDYLRAPDFDLKGLLISHMSEHRMPIFSIEEVLKIGEQTSASRLMELTQKLFKAEHPEELTLRDIGEITYCAFSLLEAEERDIQYRNLMEYHLVEWYLSAVDVLSRRVSKGRVSADMSIPFIRQTGAMLMHTVWHISQGAPVSVSEAGMQVTWAAIASDILLAFQHGGIYRGDMMRAQFTSISSGPWPGVIFLGPFDDQGEAVEQMEHIIEQGLDGISSLDVPYVVISPEARARIADPKAQMRCDGPSSSTPIGAMFNLEAWREELLERVTIRGGSSSGVQVIKTERSTASTLSLINAALFDGDVVLGDPDGFKEQYELLKEIDPHTIVVLTARPKTDIEELERIIKRFGLKIRIDAHILSLRGYSLAQYKTLLDDKPEGGRTIFELYGDFKVIRGNKIPQNMSILRETVSGI